MAVPQQLRLSGATRIGPIQPTSAPFPSQESVGSINTERTVQGARCQGFGVNSGAPAFFDLMAGSGLTALTYVWVRVRTGSFVLRFTTSAGVDQLIDLSGQWLHDNPIPGTEITALAIQGVGDIELQIAGNP